MKQVYFLVLKEILIILGITLGVFAALGLFFHTGTVDLARAVFSFLGIFVLPGYFVMLFYLRKFDFLERLAVGTVAALAIIGVFSYYLALLGVDVKYHYIIFPLAFLGLGILAIARLSKDSDSSSRQN